MKKTQFLLVLVIGLIVIACFSGCEDDYFVTVDTKDFECDYTSGDTAVAVADLPNFTGTAITAGSGILGADDAARVLNTVVESMDTACTTGAKSITAYAALALDIENEEFSYDTQSNSLDYNYDVNSVDITNFTALISGYSTASDGLIGDIFDFFAAPKATTFGTLAEEFACSLDINMKVVNTDYDEEYDSATATYSAVVSDTTTIIVHHSNQIVIDTTDGTFTINDDGSYVADGSIDILGSLSTNVGFTVSSEDGYNGKFILTISMADIEAKGLSVKTIAEEVTKAMTGSEPLTSLDELISTYLFNNADEYLTVTLTAYDNSNTEIDSISFSGTELLNAYNSIFASTLK